MVRQNRPVLSPCLICQYPKVLNLRSCSPVCQEAQHVLLYASHLAGQMDLHPGGISLCRKLFQKVNKASHVIWVKLSGMLIIRLETPPST